MAIFTTGSQKIKKSTDANTGKEPARKKNIEME